MGSTPSDVRKPESHVADGLKVSKPVHSESGGDTLPLSVRVDPLLHAPSPRLSFSNHKTYTHCGAVVVVRSLLAGTRCDRRLCCFRTDFSAAKNVPGGIRTHNLRLRRPTLTDVVQSLVCATPRTTDDVARWR